MPNTKVKPLKDYKLKELQSLAKKLKVPYSNKRKANLIKDIKKARRTKPNSKPAPKSRKKTPTSTSTSKPLTPRRNQIINVNRIPLSVSTHSKSVAYDSEKGTTIKECHNGECKMTHIPSSRSKEPQKIQEEELYLPDVMSFYEELKK